MKKKTIPVSTYKILITVMILNKNSDYPSANALQNILSGNLDDETSKFACLPTFSTLISLTNRQCFYKVKRLIKDGYLKQIYDKENDEIYLKISDNGMQIVQNFLSKHELNFERKTPRRKKSILHINNSDL